METIKTIFNQKTLKIYLRDEVDQSVFREIFKFEEYRCAKDKIKQAQLPIFDLGAHIGLFSLYCRCLNPLVKIYAFEPEINNLSLLRQHLEDNNLSNIEVIAAAVGDDNQLGKLFLTPDNQNHYLVDEINPEKSTQSTQIINLIDFCQQNQVKKISLLKMDIEGGEYQVINSLDHNWPMVESIILEYHQIIGHSPTEIIETLQSNGFGVQNFPSQFDKKMGFLWAVNKR